jgi:hypothetical protein
MVIRMPAIRISTVVVSTMRSPPGVIGFLRRLVLAGVTTSTMVPVVVTIIRWAWITTIVATIVPFVDILISITNFGSSFRFLFIDGSSSTPVSVSIVAIRVVIVAVVSTAIPFGDALVRKNFDVGAEIRFRLLGGGQSQQRGQ